MKEFIDKLINELEKLGEYCLYMNNWQGQTAICDAIEIVNELAEEYNVSEMPTGSEGFCEWKKGESSVFPIKTDCGNSIDVNYGYEFCPYCGKKIKVV